MAEGILRAADPRLEVISAGTRPETKVNPHAVSVMKEIGIDISGSTPKNVDLFLEDPFDFVITVCDNARETCPFFSGKVGKRVHIGFEDPAEARGSEEEVLPVYRKVRDQIRDQFRRFYEETIKPGLS